MTEELKENFPEVKNVKIVYYLYLASLVFGVTSIIGLVMAYINIKDAPDWIKTHYRFQIRTFWIGFLYSLISALLIVFIIGYLLLLFIAIWLIVRCVKGMGYLDKNEPHPDPTTWLF